jgi:baculoviral IAP repeat-containing protein 7/8
MTSIGKDVCDSSCFSYNKMKYEKFRVESFKNWPDAYMDVRELARNGFYFTSVDDIVECYFCKIQLGRWEADDDIATQHQKWAPYCPFVRKVETVNVKLYKNNNEWLI